MLVWSFGYLIGLLRRGRDHGEWQAGDTERLFVDAGDIAVAAGLACAMSGVLASTTIWRDYHSGKITADQSACMLDHSGKHGEEALKSLRDDRRLRRASAIVN